MDTEKIKKAVELILEGIGEDINREGLRDTPKRVANFYAEIFSGIKKDPKEEIRVYAMQNHDEMIIIRNISFTSMCEHHLLPFFGNVHIVYVPDNNKIT